LKLRGGETYGEEGRTEVGVTSANLAEKRAGDRAKETYFNVINLVLQRRYENTWKREGCISLKKKRTLTGDNRYTWCTLFDSFAQSNRKSIIEVLIQRCRIIHVKNICWNYIL